MLLLVKSGMQFLISTRRRNIPALSSPKIRGRECKSKPNTKRLHEPRCTRLKCTDGFIKFVTFGHNKLLSFLRSRKKLGARIQVVNK